MKPVNSFNIRKDMDVNEHERLSRFDLWCLTPYFSYIVAISCICGGHRSTRGKPGAHAQGIDQLFW